MFLFLSKSGVTHMIAQLSQDSALPLNTNIVWGFRICFMVKPVSPNDFHCTSNGSTSGVISWSTPVNGPKSSISEKSPRFIIVCIVRVIACGSQKDSKRSHLGIRCLAGANITIQIALSGKRWWCLHHVEKKFRSCSPPRWSTNECN